MGRGCRGELVAALALAIALRLSDGRRCRRRRAFLQSERCYFVRAKRANGIFSLASPGREVGLLLASNPDEHLIRLSHLYIGSWRRYFRSGVPTGATTLRPVRYRHGLR
jgi:hypothetical protein